ncbi:hypothetical protein C0584_01965 [Candidatus Parcubacteria bacterium]|nr:MAG: hypothetical protein C0584_01965 [Candidatus Parcubacteria bacterium]
MRKVLEKFLVVFVLLTVCSGPAWANQTTVRNGPSNNNGPQNNNETNIVNEGDVSLNVGDVIVNDGDTSLQTGDVSLNTGDVTVNEGNNVFEQGDVDVDLGGVTVNESNNFSSGDVNIQEGDVNVNNITNEADEILNASLPIISPQFISPPITFKSESGWEIVTELGAIDPRRLYSNEQLQTVLKSGLDNFQSRGNPLRDDPLPGKLIYTLFGIPKGAIVLDVHQFDGPANNLPEESLLRAISIAYNLFGLSSHQIIVEKQVSTISKTGARGGNAQALASGIPQEVILGGGGLFQGSTAASQSHSQTRYKITYLSNNVIDENYFTLNMGE